MPVGPAKFDVNQCNESPLRGEKHNFWLVSKFYTGSLPLRGILPVMNNGNCAEMAADKTSNLLTDSCSKKKHRYSSNETAQQLLIYI